jgi:hypothetical protein
MVLIALLLGLLGASRPAHADFSLTLRPGRFTDVVDLVLVMQSSGYFKCPLAATLLNLLTNAEAVGPGPQRQAILQAAIDCCNQLSREIDPATHAPFTHYFTLEGVTRNYPDLANFQHLLIPQITGRCLCIAIRRLRDNATGSFFVTVSGRGSTVSCGPL